MYFVVFALSMALGAAVDHLISGLFHLLCDWRRGRIRKMAKISAEYKDGVLRVAVPKAEEARPKRIEVKTL